MKVSVPVGTMLVGGFDVEVVVGASVVVKATVVEDDDDVENEEISVEEAVSDVAVVNGAAGVVVLAVIDEEVVRAADEFAVMEARVLLSEDTTVWEEVKTGMVPLTADTVEKADEEPFVVVAAAVELVRAAELVLLTEMVL